MHISSTHKPGFDTTVGERSNSKKFLRPRKIYLGDAKQRDGRVCPCTLVDRMRYVNAVDVVERLHDPTDPTTERTAPPCSAHV